MKSVRFFSVLAAIAFANPAFAQDASGTATPAAVDSPAPASDAEGPRGFYDLSMLMRLYPEAQATTFGAQLGAIYQPMPTRCMHLAAELAVERGGRVLGGTDLDVFVLRAALGAVWGRTTADGLWLGGGPMIDLGHARAESGGATSDVESGFVSTVSLRASARMRLKGAAFTYVDLRIGYAIAEREATLANGSTYGIGGPVAAFAIGASLGP